MTDSNNDSSNNSNASCNLHGRRINMMRLLNAQNERWAENKLKHKRCLSKKESEKFQAFQSLDETMVDHKMKLIADAVDYNNGNNNNNNNAARESSATNFGTDHASISNTVDKNITPINDNTNFDKEIHDHIMKILEHTDNYSNDNNNNNNAHESSTTNFVIITGGISNIGDDKIRTGNDNKNIRSMVTQSISLRHHKQSKVASVSEPSNDGDKTYSTSSHKCQSAEQIQQRRQRLILHSVLNLNLPTSIESNNDKVESEDAFDRQAPTDDNKQVEITTTMARTTAAVTTPATTFAATANTKTKKRTKTKPPNGSNKYLEQPLVETNEHESIDIDGVVYDYKDDSCNNSNNNENDDGGTDTKRYSLSWGNFHKSQKVMDLGTESHNNNSTSEVIIVDDSSDSEFDEKQVLARQTLAWSAKNTEKKHFTDDIDIEANRNYSKEFDHIQPDEEETKEFGHKDPDEEETTNSKYINIPKRSCKVVSAKRQYQPNPAPTAPKDNDVLFGKGTTCNENYGNVRYRSILQDHQNEYKNASKHKKKGIAQRAVNRIRLNGARFLERKGEVWVEVDNARALEKTMHRLRENKIGKSGENDHGDTTNTISGYNNDIVTLKENDVKITSDNCEDGSCNISNNIDSDDGGTDSKRDFTNDADLSSSSWDNFHKSQKIIGLVTESHNNNTTSEVIIVGDSSDSEVDEEEVLVRQPIDRSAKNKEKIYFSDDTKSETGSNYSDELDHEEADEEEHLVANCSDSEIDEKQVLARQSIAWPAKHKKKEHRFDDIDSEADKSGENARGDIVDAISGYDNDLIKLKENDVKMGRGNGANVHEGNKKYRKYAESLFQDYRDALKDNKKSIARKVISHVHSKGGRFLIKEPKTEKWVLCQDEGKIIEKTLNLFRDMTKKHNKGH